MATTPTVIRIDVESTAGPSASARLRGVRMTDSGRRTTTSGLDRLPDPCCQWCGHHVHPAKPCPADQPAGVPCPCKKETHQS